LAIVVLVTTAIRFVAHHFLEPDAHAIERQAFFPLGIALLVLPSIAVILVHRLGFLPPARVLELGSLYQFLVSFGLATLEFTRSQVSGNWSIGTSSVATWIVVFGIFVPNTPIRTLIGAVCSAGAGVLSYVVTRWLIAMPVLDRNELALWFVPTFLMAGWTYFLSRDAFQMEIDISKAREMGSYALEELLGKGEFQFFGVPLKFKGGSGSPVRAFAIVN